MDLAAPEPQTRALDVVLTRTDVARDLADELLRNGYTLVYTRFDFERMGPYLRTQDEAKREKAGFWSNEGIAARATSLMTWWEEQKKRDG